MSGGTGAHTAALARGVGPSCPRPCDGRMSILSSALSPMFILGTVSLRLLPVSPSSVPALESHPDLGWLWFPGLSPVSSGHTKQ